MPTPSAPPSATDTSGKWFLALLIAVSLAFGLILQPFYGAVFWGMVLAILFAPLQRRMLRLTGQKPNTAAFCTLASIIIIVVLPLTFIVKPELDRDIRTITLSYAFFNLSEEKLAASDRVEP